MLFKRYSTNRLTLPNYNSLMICTLHVLLAFSLTIFPCTLLWSLEFAKKFIGMPIYQLYCVTIWFFSVGPEGGVILSSVIPRVQVRCSFHFKNV